MHAMIRGAYIGNHWGEFVTLMLNAVMAVFSAMPKAGVAHGILMEEYRRPDDFDLDDFYQVEAFKARLGARKWLPSLDGFALSVAVALTFQSKVLLGILWISGVAYGWIGFILWRACRRRSMPSPRTAASFGLLFLFWFLSPTALSGQPQTRADLYDGTTRLAQATLYGYPSLKPVAYYTHRGATLTSFWIAAYFYNPTFFAYICNREHITKLPGVAMIFVFMILGWLAILAEVVMFAYYFYRQRVNDRDVEL
jgi:hypothetical protein